MSKEICHPCDSSSRKKRDLKVSNYMSRWQVIKQRLVLRHEGFSPSQLATIQRPGSLKTHLLKAPKKNMTYSPKS